LSKQRLLLQLPDWRANGGTSGGFVGEFG
jgi:hypothetical protein